MIWRKRIRRAKPGSPGRQLMLRYLASAFVLIYQVPASGQVGGPTSTGKVGRPSIELINEDIRARDAAESTRRVEAARTAEQQRRKKEKAEHDYAAKREAARAAIRDLPDTAERQQQLDQFTCMFPQSATLPPDPPTVDDCLRQLPVMREQAKRAAAAKEALNFWLTKQTVVSGT